MAGAAAQVMDDDTTGDDADEVAAQAAENAAPPGPPSKEGLQNAKDIVGQYKAATSPTNPQYQDLLTQYGINAEGARTILQNARDTLANTPITPPGYAEQAYASGLAESANRKGWGGPGIDAANAGASYTDALGKQLAALQARNQQLSGYDMSMNQAGQGALDARLKMLLANQSGWAKALPAATRVLGAEDKSQGAPSPLDPLAKLNQDHNNGLISDADYKLRAAKLNETAGQAALQDPDVIAGMHDKAADIAAYRAPLPSGGMGSWSPMALKTWHFAQQLNPNLDAATYPARQAAVMYFEGKGKGADQVQSLGAMTQHIGLLEKAATELQNNGNSPMYNWFANQIKDATGSDAPKGFENIRDIAANEVNKFIVAGQAAEADRAKQQKNISESSSMNQFFGDNGIFAGLHHLVQGQVGALKQRYIHDTRLGEDNFNQLLGSDTTDVLNSWKASPASAATTASGAPGTAMPIEPAPPEALAILEANPATAAHFKATFHYLPPGY